MAKLSASELESALGGLKDWRREGNEITKEFTLKDFVAAMAFVNKVADLAEAEQHHPDIDIRYNHVKLVLSTHSEGGVTQKDVDMAKKIEAKAS